MTLSSSASAPHRRLLARIAGALPDAITAAFFLVVWLMPLRFGNDLVKTAILVMLIEFITIHASAFFSVLVLGKTFPRGQRLLALAGLGAFYFLFVGAFVLAFEQWWPIVAFGWLLLAKFSRVLFGGSAPDREAAVQLSLWAASGFFYVVGVMLTVFLPLPRLGLTADVIPQLGLPGSGLWVEQPHRLLAFGFLYFTALATVKFKVGDRLQQADGRSSAEQRV